MHRLLFPAIFTAATHITDLSDWLVNGGSNPREVSGMPEAFGQAAGMRMGTRGVRNIQPMDPRRESLGSVNKELVLGVEGQ